MAHHLTVEERDRIAQLRYQGADQKEIARALGRCPSTISRELRRNRTDGEYYAAQAQREAQRRREERPLVRKMDAPEINEAVRAGLAQEWAPEQIAGQMPQAVVAMLGCMETDGRAQASPWHPTAREAPGTVRCRLAA